MSFSAGEPGSAQKENSSDDQLYASDFESTRYLRRISESGALADATGTPTGVISQKAVWDQPPDGRRYARNVGEGAGLVSEAQAGIPLRRASAIQRPMLRTNLHTSPSSGRT